MGHAGSGRVVEQPTLYYVGGVPAILGEYWVRKRSQPDQRVVIESMPGSTVSATNEILWTSEGTGTRVTMSVEGKPTGVLRFVPTAMLETAFREQVTESLTLLKERLESGP